MGDFQPVQGAKSLRLLLNEDGNYQELDFLEKVPTKLSDGSVVVSVDGIGPVDTGSWSYAGSALSLRSNRPNRAESAVHVGKDQEFDRHHAAMVGYKGSLP